MKNDSLLEEFKEFEVDGSKVYGGRITGCRQDGGNSYIDSTSSGCDRQISSSDSSSWMELCGGMIS